MSEGEIKQLEQKIDRNKNQILEEKEILDFIKDENNVKELAKTLENKKESSEFRGFLNSLTPTLDIAIKEIAKKNDISDQDQKLYSLYRTILSYLGESEKIEELDLLMEKIEDTVRYNTLKEEIEKETNKVLNNFTRNLASLGVNIKQGFKWGNLTKDIKEPKDVSKITEDNIQDYLAVSPNIPKEDYQYIVSNVQQLLAQHLSVYPKYVNLAQSRLGEAGGKMNIEHIQSSDKYMNRLFEYMGKFKKKPIKDQITEITKRILNPNSNIRGLNDYYVVNLWAQSLGSKKFQTILPNIFDQIPMNQCQKFFKFCKSKESFKGARTLNGAYINYLLKQKNGLKEYWGTHKLIDMKKLQEFSILKGGSPEFDALFDNTQKIKEMYDALKPLHIDVSIPLNDVQSFFKGKAVHEKKISQLKIQRKQAFENEVNRQNTTHATLSMMGPGAARMTERGERGAATNPYDKKIQEEYIALEKDYVTLLLKSKTFKKDLFNGTIGIKNGPKGRIQGLSSAGVILDFSKGNNPDSIVRDRFGEMTQDQWNQFLWNMNNDRQAAFGSFVGMIGGIAGASAATLLTGATNPLITGAGFTVGLRLGNGIGQEAWNTGEWIYEQTSGKTINDGNNKVEQFGQGFLRGVGWLDPNYKEVGTGKFLSQLGFDYVASAATFGLSNKFGGFLGKLEGVKFAGGALKFGMEELIIENFLVDIPNNILQTGFETLTGIDNQIMVGNTVVGQKTGLENERETKAGSLSDMLLVMGDAFKQNFSFENMSQTLFNTVIYGGLLEGGGAAFRKMRSSLPSGQVANFEAKSAISMAALGGFTKFLTDSHVKVDQKTGKLIDSKTGNALIENDPRVQEMRKRWESIQATEKEVVSSMQTLIETQKKIIADPNNPQGLLFRLGLISPSNSPLNILKKKKEIAENRLADKKAKSNGGDSKKIAQLEQLISQYTDAEIKIKNGLSESTTDGNIKSEKESYFEGKESKFGLSESNNEGTGDPGNKQNREQNNNEKTSDQISPLVQKINNSVFEHVVNSQELKLIASTEIENGMLEIGETGKIINAYIEVNGEKSPSKLFKSLIDGGLSSEQSLKSRLQTRTTEFKEWFGDWQTNPESASKIVDENGEPLVMWHGTTRKFNEFSHNAQRNYENIGNTKDWFYFSNLYNFSEKEYSGIGNMNNALSDFYVTYIENYEGEDRLNYFENKRNDHIEGLSNGKTIINEMDHIMYEGQTTEGGFIKYCFNDKNPKTEDFEKRERKWKVEDENGNIEEIPLNIYIPKGEIYFNPLPFFIKGNNVSQGQDFIRDQVIPDMDYNINKAIENGNAKTDIIRVNDKNTGNIIIGVKDATQIKSAVNNDGSFSLDSGKFNDYFGKKPKLAKNMDSSIAYENSSKMDNIIDTINEQNKIKKLQELREEISKQYQEATGKALNLTDEQLLSVLDAHEQDGKLGELTLGELKRKVKVLDQTITDPEVRRFLLEAGFCSNESKINIVDFKKMNETEILEYAKNNFDTIIENYKKKYGNIVNADDFRDFVGGDIGVDANITHQAASYLADTYFEKLLEKNRGKGNNTIKFLAGGPGSGKSSISSISPNNDYAAVLDGTLKTYTNAERNIEKALSLGYNVRVEFVYRDMNESFINGVLKRTISQNQSLAYKTGESGLGRTVPLHIFEKGHNGARETILKLYDKYGPDVVKIFGGSDKNLDIGNGILQKTKTKNGIPPFVYEYDKSYTTNLIKENQFEKERSILAIQEAYLRGKITEKQKLELLGE